MCVRVCMRVRMWVRWMAQDAGANGSWSEGTQAPGATTTTGTQATTTSTRAGAQPQERERDQSERTSRHLHTRV